LPKRSQSTQIPKELTRKQLSRAERDARRTRLLLLGVGGALALVILLIGFGVVRDTVILPNEPVAIVGDRTILTREFQQRVRLARSSLRQQLDFFQQVGLTDNANQAAQQLADRQGLGAEVINRLVDEAVYRQAAPELSVSVAADEVQTSIEEQFNYFRVPPTPAPTRTPAPTSTAPATITVTPQPTATPRPTATPVTAEGFQQLYQQQLSGLARFGMSEADYRRYIESQLIADRVQEVLLSSVVTVTDQVQFQYILASSQADINQVQQAIDTDSFDSVYGQVLSETFVITTVGAAQVPFTPKDQLVDSSQLGPSFADAVFSTPISGTFGVVTNTSGTLFYVGRVLGHEVRELDRAALQRVQSATIQDWLNERRTLLNVQVLTWEDRVPGDP